MPLLHNGIIVETDPWIVIDDDTDLPVNIEHVLVTLTRYLELQANTASLPAGVIIGPTDQVHDLSPYTNQLQLIGIDFPAYTDGRGYTHARLLRKRLKYAGELRAFGDVRADCILFMQRSGIDSFEFNGTPDTQLIEALTSRYQKNYQPSYPLPCA